MKKVFVSFCVVFFVALLAGCPDLIPAQGASGADLSELYVSSGVLSPVFSAGNQEYSVSVSNSVSTITVTGIPADSTATVGGLSGQSVSLAVGSTEIEVIVTGSDGVTVKTYIVTVHRSGSGTGGGARIADHTIVHQLWDGLIPESDIVLAKNTLHIGYGHTSHGSQLATGMSGLIGFANGGNLGGTEYSDNLFAFNASGSGGALHFFEGSGYETGWLELDAGYYPGWVSETEAFLAESAHAQYNVIMWSWCGQLSGMSEVNLINRYLNEMSEFEAAHPDITFVYMTGHLDGTGETGILHQRNQQIRNFCIANDKWLYDFADIESHNPEGVYFLNRRSNDECGYDSNADGAVDSNWAIEWQNSHTQGTDWFACSPDHTQPVNGNMKAYAAWWLFVQIARERTE